jgi:cation transport ATPase
VTSKLSSKVAPTFQSTRTAGAAIVAVAIDGILVGEIALADELRAGVPSLL